MSENIVFNNIEIKPSESISFARIIDEIDVLPAPECSYKTKMYYSEDPNSDNIFNKAPYVCIIGSIGDCEGGVAINDLDEFRKYISDAHVDWDDFFIKHNTSTPCSGIYVYFE